jgi:ketosteroid isomerase-like protein
MKIAQYVLISTGLLLAGHGISNAAECSAEVQTLEAAWYNDLKAADGPKLHDLLSPDFKYQHPTGNTYDRDTVVDLFATRKVTVAKTGLVELSCDNFGDTVVASGSNSIEGLLSGQAYSGKIRFVNVWHRADGKWQLAHRNSEILPAN